MCRPMFPFSARYGKSGRPTLISTNESPWPWRTDSPSRRETDRTRRSFPSAVAFVANGSFGSSSAARHQLFQPGRHRVLVLAGIQVQGPHSRTRSWWTWSSFAAGRPGIPGSSACHEVVGRRNDNPFGLGDVEQRLLPTTHHPPGPRSATFRSALQLQHEQRRKRPGLRFLDVEVGRGSASPISGLRPMHTFRSSPARS